MRTFARSCVYAVLAVALLAPAPVAVAAEPFVYANRAAFRAMEDLCSAYLPPPAPNQFILRIQKNVEMIPLLADGKCQLIVHNGEFEEWQFERYQRTLKRPFPATTVEIGRHVVAVVVNAANPVRSLSTRELGGIYQGQIKSWKEIRTWSDVDGAAKPIKCFGQPQTTNAYGILQEHCFPFRFPRDDCQWIKPTEELFAAIRAEPAAIGFFLYDGQGREWSVPGVRLVPIAPHPPDGDLGEPHLPTAESVATGEYPLYHAIRLLLHPQAAPKFREFVRRATSDEAGDILRKLLVWPESDRRKATAARRWAEVKAGKAGRVTAAGEREGKELLQAALGEFVSAQAAAQLTYTPGKTEEAVERFVDGSADLLLASEPLSEAMVRKHGAEWLFLAPQAVPLGRQAIAIVVHPTNKFESLRREQLQSIFTGQIRDWWTLEAGPTAIVRHGLKPNEPLARMFQELTLAAGTSAKIDPRATSAEILKEVAANPQAIGFVDAAAIDPQQAAVRVVPLAWSEGEAAGLRDARYPLARSWTLYASPRGGKLARAFAQFLAEGQSPQALAAAGLLPTPLLPK